MILSIHFAFISFLTVKHENIPFSLNPVNTFFLAVKRKNRARVALFIHVCVII